MWNVRTLQNRNYDFLHRELHIFILDIFAPNFTNIYIYTYREPKLNNFKIIQNTQLANEMLD